MAIIAMFARERKSRLCRVATKCASRRNRKLPALKTGGLYKAHCRRGRTVLKRPFRSRRTLTVNRPVFSGKELITVFVNNIA
jgi:hypothetical protein